MQEFLARVKPRQKKFFTELRSGLRSLPEVEETIEIDELGGDWCPTYRVRGEDLVWVHFDGRLWLRVPLDSSFEKKVLQDENLDTQVTERVKDAEETDGVKWARLEIRSGDQVD